MAACFGQCKAKKSWESDAMIRPNELQKWPEKKKKNKNKKKASDQHRREMALEIWGGGKAGEIKKLSWREVEMMTNNLSTVIGHGGFSTVYLARLPLCSGHLLGAIKILNNGERQNRIFRQELDVLVRICHENIVKLLAYCDDKEEGVLLFEMIPNGSLHEKLQDPVEAKAALTWQQRMTIAFGVARAVEYLHDRCEVPIIHCDIKASNVLLHHGLVPKLCDFGFARAGLSSPAVLPNNASVMGSPGYVDPHYLRTGIVSKKNDVYSFGVLLLELLTGVEAFSAEKEQILTRFAAGVIRNPTVAGDFVDARLGGRFEVEQARGIASVAASCLHEKPDLRPSMADVLSLLAVVISSKGDSVER